MSVWASSSRYQLLIGAPEERRDLVDRESVAQFADGVPVGEQSWHTQCLRAIDSARSGDGQDPFSVVLVRNRIGYFAPVRADELEAAKCHRTSVESHAAIVRGRGWARSLCGRRRSPPSEM